MAGETMTPLDLTGAGLLESLGSTPVGLDLGHCLLLLWNQIVQLISSVRQ
jgi:hypothetical protein